MKVNVRTFGAGNSKETFDDITAIQTSLGGTIVWMSMDGFGADILLTIEFDNHVVQNGNTLWVRGKGRALP